MSHTKADNKTDISSFKNKVHVKFDNIYMIDDDSFTLYLNKYFIKKYDFVYNNLLEFQNGKEAVESLKNVDTSKHHLVLLDLNMPLMCGWELTNLISATFSKEQLGCIYVNIVSSSSNPIDIERAETHPNIFSYIEKPFLPRQFEKIIMDIDDLISAQTD